MKKTVLVITLLAIAGLMLSAETGSAVIFDYQEIYTFGVIGDYDLDVDVISNSMFETAVSVVNPIPYYTDVFVLIMDADENVLTCETLYLSPQDSEIIDIREALEIAGEPIPPYGVVKALQCRYCHLSPNIVGYTNTKLRKIGNRRKTVAFSKSIMTPMVASWLADPSDVSWMLQNEIDLYCTLPE